MTKNILIAMWLTTSALTFAQNLINNPGFELMSEEPDKKGYTFPCIDWERTDQTSTPNYYNSRRKGTDGEGEWRKPYSGRACVGMVIVTDTMYNSPFCEYIQGKLNQKLVKDNYYCFSLYISPAKHRSFTSNEIDYYFSEEKIYSSKKECFIKLSNYERLIGSKGVFEPNAWSKISGCYRARGGEEYLIIGLFNPYWKRVCFNIKDREFHGFYYYIDDVSLVPVKDPSKCECNKIEVFRDNAINYALALDKPLVMNNINFETGKAQLLPSSNKELEQLAAFLKTNATYKIKITGHTDNVGSEADNIKLSEARAGSVAEFLISAGVAKERITYNGLGSKSPIKPNDTDENKKLNRRVEFSISK